MREVINGLIDNIAADGRADFATDICEPYPIPIICELLGAPKKDWQLFSRWAGDILEIFSADVVDKLEGVQTDGADRPVEPIGISSIELSQ